MKCDTCDAEVVIRDGTKGGYCHVCGTPFRVDEKGSQVYDPEFVERFIEGVSDRVVKRLKPPDPPEDPPPDPPDPPEHPDKKWEK